ncbi:MAG: chemotaxis protein CheX [Candidatus Sulfotelmatobacter sp.]
MSGSPSISAACAIAPRTTWPAILGETAIEVFSTMAGVAPVIPEGSDFPFRVEVTGMVGIAGPLGAVFSLRCSLHCATMIASRMLGVPANEAAAQKCDAVGEICNMVAGYFKAKIGLGDRCVLSVPTVVAGKNYQIRCRHDDVRMEMLLLYESEPIWIALDIRP